jgi:hypothetical protein
MHIIFTKSKQYSKRKRISKPRATSYVQKNQQMPGLSMRFPLSFINVTQRETNYTFFINTAKQLSETGGMSWF